MGGECNELHRGFPAVHIENDPHQASRTIEEEHLIQSCISQISDCLNCQANWVQLCAQLTQNVYYS